MSKEGERIVLGHGGGGRLSRELIQREIVTRFGEGPLAGLPDAARLFGVGDDLFFTTDSFVVKPLFFPGGDIGRLAVYGTVNDLAVSGARALYLSLAIILEEGFEMEAFRRILDSVKKASQSSGVIVATGDTKVVGRGECDGIFLNTAGVGAALGGFALGGSEVKPGDAVVVSGPIAEHGTAIMAARTGLPLENPPESDAASVLPLVTALGALAPAMRLMRDPTRGGMASVLNEFVSGEPFGIELEETRLPIAPRVRGVTEALGLDPLHIACEGRIVGVVEREQANRVVDCWRRLPEGRDAAVIGEIMTHPAGRVVLMTVSGGRRLVDVPEGELLPRIC